MTIVVLRHVRHEHLGTMKDVFRRENRRFTYVDLWKKRIQWPSPEDTEAVVIMGGPMGVYEREKHPFIVDELRFLKAFLKTGRPLLGICLGAQMIAAALGGKVFPNNHKEIGWYPLATTSPGKKDPLFRFVPNAPEFFQWHGDTFSLPRKTTLLARSPLCRHQAFRFRENVYALQFHLEVTAPMVRHWLRQPGASRELAAVGPAAAREARRRLDRRIKRLQESARPFFTGWTRLIRKPFV